MSLQRCKYYLFNKGPPSGDSALLTGLALGRQKVQRRTFVNGNMISHVAFDHVLRVILRRVPHIPFEESLRGEFSDDYTAHQPGF